MCSISVENKILIIAKYDGQNKLLLNREISRLTLFKTQTYKLEVPSNEIKKVHVIPEIQYEKPICENAASLNISGTEPLLKKRHN